LTTEGVDGDEIFILPSSLLHTHRALKGEFQALSHRVGVAPGWHYLLDLAWAGSQLLNATNKLATVLDAGAGVGLMQWWMAGRGIDVISVDRSTRYFSRRMRSVAPLTGAPGVVPSMRMAATRRMAVPSGSSPVRWLGRAARAVPDLALGEPPKPGGGQVIVIQSDLRKLPDVSSESVDAVVSISSLEHNTLEDIPLVVSELMRVLKPGGRLIGTVGVARDRDWFHEPSRGWCFAEATLRSLFGLATDCPSNFASYDTLMRELRACDELRLGLARSYFGSGANGMPWGRWDPQYQSAGFIRVKPVSPMRIMIPQANA
jgi:SAM-dependent methyltransferase